MRFERLAIPDVVLIETIAFGDERGFFQETWNKRAFLNAGFDLEFVQDNHSRSVKNTLRGMHYQLHHPQTKLVRVVRGEIFDVAIDMRRHSRTFGQWVAATLSEANRHQLLVPTGFAHGFLVRSDCADVLYKTTDFYAPNDQHCIHWNDAAVGVQWPMQSDAPPLLSAMDHEGLSLEKSEVFP